MASIGVHIFRKDLRVPDNIALSELSKKVDAILPIFILDPKQIRKTETNRSYFSEHAVQFICESLDDLDQQTHHALIILEGDPKSVLHELCEKLRIANVSLSHVSYNLDYSKYSMSRDASIRSMCESNSIVSLECPDDQTLVPISNLCKSDGSPYMVYGSFAKNERKSHVSSPIANSRLVFWNDCISSKRVRSALSKINVWEISDLRSLYKENGELAQRGGRTNALARLSRFDLSGFDKRDDLTEHSFEISAHLNFGCISIREMYHRYRNHKSVVDQLIWRDFYLSILRFNDRAREYTFLDKRLASVRWRSNEREWKRLIDCSTGFLLIDAAMSQMKRTGYIGGRARLLLGTFWCKYLGISPFDVKYGSHSGFSRYLVDCVTSQNKGNHNWLTSELDLNGRRFHKRGCPSMSGRMIRIDNEMIKKYDKNGDYIRTWLPKCRDMTVRDMIRHPTMFEWEPRYMEYCAMIRKVDH